MPLKNSSVKDMKLQISNKYLLTLSIINQFFIFIYFAFQVWITKRIFHQYIYLTIEQGF
jgi:hypothetical protein